MNFLRIYKLTKCVVSSRAITTLPVTLSRGEFSFLFAIEVTDNQRTELCFLDIRSGNGDKPEKKERASEMMILIRATNETHELLDLLSSTHKNDIEPMHLSRTLSHLMDLQRHGDSSIQV